MNAADIESAIESISNASVTKSSAADLNVTTGTLERLAVLRAGIQSVFVSQEEMTVSPIF